MGILNVSFYLKFRNNGSALISVLILLGFVSSLLAILLNVGKQDQEQIDQYQKNNIIYTHIHAVEDFAINILNIDFQNSPNMTYQSENWGNPIEPFSVGSYTVSLKIKDLQSKININSLVLNNSDINYIQLERLVSLFDQLDINQDLIYAIIDWIDYDSEVFSSSGGEDDYYLSLNPGYRAANRAINNLDEVLLIKGFDKTILKKLKPYLSAIPREYDTNINTININTISALHPMIGLINAENIIRYRNEKPFESVKDFAYYCKYNLRLSDSTINEITNMITTKSENFLIEGKISMSDHNLSFSTIINHDLDGSRFLKHNRVIQKIKIM